MKIHLLLLPLLIIGSRPVAASAQAKPKATARQISIAPDAKALFDQATVVYANAKSLCFDVQTLRYLWLEYHLTGNLHVEFARPNFLHVADLRPNVSEELFLDGKSLDEVLGKIYWHDPNGATAQKTSERMSLTGLGSYWVTRMLAGISPLDVGLRDLQLRTGGTSSGEYLKAVLLIPRVVDGEVLTGVQMRVSHNFLDSQTKLQKAWEAKETFWFGKPNGILRRVQARFRIDGEPTSDDDATITVFSNVQLNPRFAPDTFDLDPSGLELQKSPTR